VADYNDEYCVSYATPAALGGTIVGACSATNCLGVLQTVPHVIYCRACQESGCNNNNNNNLPVATSGATSRCHKIKRRGGGVVATTTTSVLLALLLAVCNT